MQFFLSLQSFDYDCNQFDYHVQRVIDGCYTNDGHISVNCFVSDDQRDARITDALIESLINDDHAQCEHFFSIVLQRITQALKHDNVPLFIDMEC